MSTRLIFQNLAFVYRELFRFSRQSLWQMPLYALIRIVSPLIISAIPAVAIAMLTERSLTEYVLGISALLLVNVVLAVFAILLENRFTLNIIGVRVKGFCSRLLHKCLTMDFCNIEPADKQKKMYRGMGSIISNNRGVEGLIRYSFELLYGLFGLLSYGFIMFSIHWSILLIVAGTTVATFFLKRHAILFWRKLADERYPAARVITMLKEQGISLEYGKDIRIYHVENWFRKIFDEQIRKIYRLVARQELHWYFPTAGEQVGNFIRDFVMYMMLIRMVLSGGISVSQFTFYVGVVAGFSVWMNEAVTHLSQVMETNVEMEYYMDAMNISDVFLHGEGKKPDGRAEVSIEFRDVSFRYEEDGKDILSHLSFRIEPGEKAALVGNNGAGKTTIVKLLCGFYLPTEGEVLINGYPTSDYDMDEYGKLISPVFQDGFMSAFTVAMNVAGGKEEDIDRDRVRRCLKEAGIWEKIDSLENKEETYVTQTLERDGVNFSGGEIQKLLIARALYKNGKCLILDEPTSALDPIAESRVYQEYNDMTREKTSVFISHRLASTRFCDKILYLEDGRVLEQGTHEELLAKNGAYAKMFEIQSHYYQKDNSQTADAGREAEYEK